VSKRARSKGQVDRTAALLAQGMAAQRAGDLERAAAAYRAVLDGNPRQPDALNLLGLVLCARGALPASIEKIRRATEVAPDVAMYHASLGRVLGEAGDSAGSIAALERAVELDQSLLPAVYNLGLAHEARGDLESAEQHYRWAEEGDSPVPEASYNLGNLLVARGRLSEAIAAYRRAIARRPGYERALSNLALAFQKQGNMESATATYRELIAAHPDSAEARHMLAALTGEARDRADPGYVQRFFDSYAQTFEKVLLDELAYDTPKALAELAREYAETPRFERALDLGCGTGLSGRALAGLCQAIVGVDLSPNMLAIAEEKGGYAELHAADLLTFLESDTSRFDLVIASDVLNYLGELDTTFGLVVRRSSPRALFVFSTEAGEGRFQLAQTGRFCHGREYVAAAASAAGFDLVVAREQTLRLERGTPVRGDLFVLRAPG
jgi:predicted TPR repeat methyltransferase